MTRIVVRNPARTDEVVGELVAATPADSARACARAERAARGWADTAFEERAMMLEQGLAGVEAIAGDLASVLCRELGKIHADCAAEIGFSIAVVRDAIERARRLVEPTIVEDAQGRLEVRRRPYGVVVAITPWNAPVVLAALKAGPAVAAGNTVIIKPSPIAPLAVTRAFEALAAALPDGVAQVLVGGADLGEALVGDPHVAKVAFTGGVATGRAVARTAGARGIPVVLELGGNDAAIVLDDADLSPEMIERAVYGSFLTSGQVCMAAKRLYVHASRADEFVSTYRKVADEVLVVGDPMDPVTTVGPVATGEGKRRVEALLADARARGGEVLDLGRVPDPAVLAHGHFVRPALVLGLGDDAPLVAEEQFGPAVPLLTFHDEDEVIARANASALGLASSVWSADEARARAIARRLEAGFTFINTHNRAGLSLRAPFGGTKASGFGREYGDEGLLEYVQTHAINAPASTEARAYPGGTR